jgi:hypothetical protein
VLGVTAAVGAVVWQVAIPLGLLAIGISWLAASAARGRDARSIGLAVAGLTTGAAGILLAVLSAFAASGADEPSGPQTIDGIESSTPDQANPPQKDLEPGTRCTVEIAGLRADGAVVNRTAKAWRYSITVAWQNGDEDLATSTLLLDAVQPGGRSAFRATNARTGTTATTCTIVSIDRLAP